MFSVFIAVGMFFNSLKDNKINITKDTIKNRRGLWNGIERKRYKINKIGGANFLKISYKMNGFALENVKKGYFKTKSGEQVKFYINYLRIIH